MRVHGPDRVAKRHPRPPLDAVHDEPAPPLVEEQRLVAQVDEVRGGGRLRPDNVRGRVDIGIGRVLGLVPCGRDDP